MGSTPPLVAVGSWTSDEDNPIYPKGANPKRFLICPTPAPHAELIAGHKYLFKTGVSWKARQMWSELIAAKMGELCGVPVPKCFIGIDENTGEAGALIEFFFGYPDETPPLRFNHGSDLTQSILRDNKKGRPHSVRYNVQVCRKIYGISDAADWWGTVLAFDALIGNTDRHPENWGVLVKLWADQAPEHRMAPAFDNGTSLSYEIVNAKLPGIRDESWFKHYISKGTHHCGWELKGNAGLPHFELCERFARRHPTARSRMQSVIRYDEPAVTEFLAACQELQVPEAMSSARAAVLEKLLKLRRQELERALP